MVDGDKSAFATAIGAMAETFGVQATRPLLHGYWLGLCDLDLHDVELAVGRAIRECDRLPRPVELRRLAGESTDEQAAIVAWGDVLRAVPLGPYRHVDFSGNKTINAVIRNMGGWPSFVSRFADADSEKWIRAEFIRAYRNLANGAVSDDATAPLAGLAKIGNYGRGNESPRVVCVECRSRSKPIVGQPRLEQTIATGMALKLVGTER